MSNAVKIVLGTVGVLIALGAWGGMSQDESTSASSEGSLEFEGFTLAQASYGVSMAH